MDRRTPASEHPAGDPHESEPQDHDHDDSAEIEELRRRIETLRVDLAQADRRVRILLRQRPGLAIATALLGGFVLGRIIRRI